VKVKEFETLTTQALLCEGQIKLSNFQMKNENNIKCWLK